MRARLRYLAVLIVSIAAAAIGAWPSLLTVGAVLAIATGAAALIGAAKPSTIDSRVTLRRFTIGGGAVLALELLALAAYTAATPRRTVHLVVPSNAPGVVRVIYNVRDGASSPPWRWDRYFNAGSGAAALIHTRLPADDGWFRPDRPHPVVARTTAGETVRSRWIAGGYAEAESCSVAFDEFAIGPDPIPPRDPGLLLGAGWLDSLSTWAIECRGSRLFRKQGGTALRRTSAACYFGDSGYVTCGGSTDAQPGG